MSKANDKQFGGDHYKGLPIEVWDIVALLDLDAFQHSILKYVIRWKEKGGIVDLEKAKHYLEKYIEVQKLLASKKGRPEMIRAILQDALDKLNRAEEDDDGEPLIPLIDDEQADHKTAIATQHVDTVTPGRDRFTELD